MKHARLLPLLLVAIAPIGCKPAATKAVSLKDAPPAVLEDGWQPIAIEGAGFTFALPPDWKFALLHKDGLETQVRSMNDNAWDMLGKQKADVNFDTARAVVGLYVSPVENLLSSNTMVTQTVVAIREETGRTMGLKEAAARWRDTVRVEGAKDEPKEGVLDLAVGAAATVSSASIVMGFIEKLTVVCLVDGSVAYTFIFHEEATGDAKPVAVQAIMATFRPSP